MNAPISSVVTILSHLHVAASHNCVATLWHILSPSWAHLVVTLLWHISSLRSGTVLSRRHVGHKLSSRCCGIPCRRVAASCYLVAMLGIKLSSHCRDISCRRTAASCYLVTTLGTKIVVTLLWHILSSCCRGIPCRRIAASCYLVARLGIKLSSHCCDILVVASRHRVTLLPRWAQIVVTLLWHILSSRCGIGLSCRHIGLKWSSHCCGIPCCCIAISVSYRHVGVICHLLRWHTSLLHCGIMLSVVML